MANSSFSEYFYVTPDNTNSLALLVSGLSTVSVPEFFDRQRRPQRRCHVLRRQPARRFQRSGEQRLHAAGQYALSAAYRGFHESLPPGGNGLVSISAINAEVSPVPESDAYAMLLAGLGLMGVVARRRSRR